MVTQDAPAWAALIIEHHAVAGYFLAAGFPLWRYFFRMSKDIAQRLTVPIAIHQAATGFVLPAFVLLLGSYAHPPLATHISPHEMGVAGLMGLISGGRELFVHD